MLENDNRERATLADFRQGDGAPAMLDTSPMPTALGCRIESAREGEVTLGFEPGAAYVQGNGVIAGGAVATMLVSAWPARR